MAPLYRSYTVLILAHTVYFVF